MESLLSSGDRLRCVYPGIRLGHGVGSSPGRVGASVDARTAHAADARAVGLTTHGIRIGHGRGGIVRVRKNWLVRSDAPPAVRRAQVFFEPEDVLGVVAAAVAQGRDR